MLTFLITISGVVQGVGFRPFIYNLAVRYKFDGVVFNNSYGVQIELNTDEKTIQKFIDDIKKQKPPLSQIDNLSVKKIEKKSFDSFKIIKTKQSHQQKTKILPDISICKECEMELKDPTNKRYKYPFITCTSCGPRWSIIKSLPYDRNNTSFDKFKMCQECQDEYNNPKDRRYHAQPIGCFSCGPVLNLRDKNKNIKTTQKDMITQTAKLIKDGFIVAIKGVGGYHLVCDATSDKAVGLLRERKKRPHKPLAVMIKDINQAKKLSNINQKEQDMLLNKARPIVVLQKKQNKILSKYIADHIDKIGLFLPYSPVHILLLDILNSPIVATSANISGEPLCLNSKDIDKIDFIWDYCLEYNREIINSSDDSVVTFVDDQPIFYRVARGFAPISIKLPYKLDENILTVGANQKSTISLAFDDMAVISPHIGDISTIKSIEHFKKNIKNLTNIYNFTPDTISCDKHPNYESTKYAIDIQKRKNININKVGHHYAHIRAVMIEKNITKKVLGVSWDGTGYGDDGKLWGGEFMVCDMVSSKRVCSLKAFKLIGGEKAIKEPARIVLAMLFDIYGKEAMTIEHEAVRYFTPTQLNTFYLMWQKDINTPVSSSIGRLFDMVASICGLIHSVTYEGQSGAMTEKYFDKNITSSYSFDIKDGYIDTIDMVKQMLKQKDKTLTISKFYRTLVNMIYEVYQKEPLPVVLGGGVFQNALLVKLIKEKIKDTTISSILPPNDGSICLGQIGKHNNIVV